MSYYWLHKWDFLEKSTSNVDGDNRFIWCHDNTLMCERHRSKLLRIPSNVKEIRVDCDALPPVAARVVLELGRSVVQVPLFYVKWCYIKWGFGKWRAKKEKKDVIKNYRCEKKRVKENFSTGPANYPWAGTAWLIAVIQNFTCLFPRKLLWNNVRLICQLKTCISFCSDNCKCKLWKTLPDIVTQATMQREA